MPRRYCLGDAILDVDTRQLLKDGRDVHLSPKAFDLLILLVEQRPRALSKSELHERLWPATFVSEANLASLAAEIREALGDNARQPTFVRTVHRFGYAFCGAIDADDAETAAAATTFSWLIRDGTRLPLRSGDTILGRDPAGGVRIDAPTVSRRHARISIAGSEATIEDLDSKNGTFVRGTPVHGPVPLADGDEVRVGSVVLHFRRIAPGGSTVTA